MKRKRPRNPVAAPDLSRDIKKLCELCAKIGGLERQLGRRRNVDLVTIVGANPSRRPGRKRPKKANPLGVFPDYDAAYAAAQPLANQMAGKVTVAIEKAREFGRTVYRVKFVPNAPSKRTGWETRAEIVEPMRGTRRTRRNPSPTAELRQAAAAFKQFHGVNPRKVSKGGGRGVLVSLGELREIVYQPTRGERKGPAFFHNFKAGNILAVTADGERLVIVDRKNRTAVDFDLGIVS